MRVDHAVVLARDIQVGEEGRVMITVIGNVRAHRLQVGLHQRDSLAVT
jgi:hypothetical protein